MVNFNHPYVAVNPIQRWQRWHISLSSWLRDYLYIPLGGNRKGTFKTLRNLAVTFVLGGLWHGAAWNFVLWGAWEGMMVVVHRLFQPIMEEIHILRRILPKSLIHFLKMLFFFQMVCIGLTIFRSQSVAHMYDLFKTILTTSIHPEVALLMPLIQFVTPLIVIEWVQYSLSKDQWAQIQKIPVWARTQVYAIMFYMIAFHGAAAQSFIYFQF
jgi:D-alanyl-lipoteichoic acid acyltransferase DltB (MBOAT superfamily)